MKKGLAISAAVLALALLALLAAAPAVNDHAARETADRLAALPLPEDTRLLETVCQAGKLAGNGNGMQYFGAMLLESGLSLEELREYYSRFAEKEWECAVEEQRGREIEALEHTELAFRTDAAGDRCFIVYSWGTNPTVFHELDLRGH